MDLPTKLLSNPRPAGARRLPDMVAEYEAAVIRDALRRHNQNIPAAARELGIDRSLLYRKIQKAGIIIKRVLEEPS